MSNLWHHEEAGKFDVELLGGDRTINDADRLFGESIVEAADDLFQKASTYMLPFIDRTRAEFSQPPYLNRIEITATSISTYSVRVELYFDADERAYWWVTFNVPYPFPPFPSGSERTYTPVEFGRRIE